MFTFSKYFDMLVLDSVMTMRVPQLLLKSTRFVFPIGNVLAEILSIT
jgi:hypothetical protein